MVVGPSSALLICLWSTSTFLLEHFWQWKYELSDTSVTASSSANNFATSSAVLILFISPITIAGRYDFSLLTSSSLFSASARLMSASESESMWNDFFTKERIDLLNSIFDTIDTSGQNILPDRVDVLEIFGRAMILENYRPRTVIIGQSPYPSADDACGVPFVSKSRRCPKSLEMLKLEIEMEYGRTIADANAMVLSWVKDEMVFIMNKSPTMGIGLPRDISYLEDHSVLWGEFMDDLIRFLTRDKQIPVILMGKMAWELEAVVKKSECVIKVPHPVSRGDKKFVGCGVFTDVNKYLESVGRSQIRWIH